MTELDIALAGLRQFAVIATESPSSAAQLEEDVADLLESYPGLGELTDYLEFLRTTGGAHVHNSETSLILYGFGGYVVPSFEEGYFLDRERYFLFGEVMSLDEVGETTFLAFDLASGSDHVHRVQGEDGTYVVQAGSFVEMLREFARGRPPGPRTAPTEDSS